MVILPFGSIEHHGPHLPLGSDALLADAVGRQVAERLGAVVAPTVRIGDADAHVDRFGTLTLGAMTLADIAVASARSLGRQGFRRIVLLSTHGGNARALSSAVERVARELPDETTVIAPRGDVGPSPGAHSGEWLTSVMLALHPQLVHLEQADPALEAELRSADAQRGRAHLERFVASIVRQVA